MHLNMKRCDSIQCSNDLVQFDEILINLIDTVNIRLTLTHSFYIHSNKPSIKELLPTLFT